jgi:hypothetical protein
MKEPAVYIEQVFEALGAQVDRETGQMSLEWSYDTIGEAKLVKKELIMHQKELRAIKRDVNADMKTIRHHFKAETDSVEAGLMTTLFGGKRRAGQERAQKKREIMARRDSLLEPYETVKCDIDNILLEIDKSKLDVDRFVMEGPPAGELISNQD